MEALIHLAAGGVGQLIGQAITVAITFAATVYVLKLLFFSTILDTIDARKKQITDQFEELDQKIETASEKQKNYETKLANFNEEAREIQNKAIEDGKRIAAEIEAQAKQDAEKIVAKAKSDMDLELEKARITIRREAVEMTLHATGKLLAVELNDERHRELVEGFVSEISNKESNG